MCSDYSVVATHDLAVRSQNYWLQTGFVPIETSPYHVLNHLIDLISVKTVFTLGGLEPFATKCIGQVLSSCSVGWVHAILERASHVQLYHILVVQHVIALHRLAVEDAGAPGPCRFQLLGQVAVHQRGQLLHGAADRQCEW